MKYIQNLFIIFIMKEAHINLEQNKIENVLIHNSIDKEISNNTLIFIDDHLMISNLKENIKKLRKLKGLSQTDIAKSLNIDQSTYGKIESGNTEITFDKLEKISYCLNMKILDIITYPEKFIKITENNVLHDANVTYNTKKKYYDIEEANYRIRELEGELKKANEMIDLLLNHKK